MDLKDQARKEPSLADLEAFERLLRDSLQHDRGASAPPAEPAPTAPAPVAPTASMHDQAAMAELARLSAAPLSFELPDFGEALPGAAPVAPTLPQPAAVEPVAPAGVQGTANARLGEDWSAMAEVLPSFAAEAERTIYAPHRAEQPVPPTPEIDPLKAFEDELRRFDAANGYAAAPLTPEMPDLRADYPGHAAHQPAYTDPTQAIVIPDSDPSFTPSWQGEQSYPEQTPSAADQSLADAEAKLAAEAAAAAAAGDAVQGGGRSKMIFYALGGIAVAGLVAIGGSLAFGSKKSAANKDVPVIAAKTEPAKEKPANPGGIEIPDQNKQILAAKNAISETKPAQVVNTTEQPMDLNQVTKRDSVRVIAPNPYQPAPSGTAQPDANATAPTTPPANEPKRVQSVRIGDPITPPKAAPAPASNAIPTLGTAGAAAGGAAAIAAIAAASARPTTPPAPTAPVVPKATPPAPAPAAATPPAPPKVEARPATAATTPRVAAPTPAAAPRPVATPPKAANAPLQLNPSQRPVTPAQRPPQVATAPTSGGSGGFAVQLASRPTQADANAASGQLASKYSSALGGKPARVVSGEANGKTVYRVRVGGYSQAEAAAACERVKAAGGGCFVTRQ